MLTFLVQEINLVPKKIEKVGLILTLKIKINWTPLVLIL